MRPNQTPRTVYLNLKSTHGIETVDEFSPESMQSMMEYWIAGMNVYQSSKPCKDWKFNGINQ